MHLERLILTNFRCFGPESETIHLSSGLTAFIGANGCGKTAVLQALLRLFGITNEQRHLCRQDFHVPLNEHEEPRQRTLSIEAILAFPELAVDDHALSAAIPAFFYQMSVDESGQLKCRLRLDAIWTADGSLDGFIETKYRVIRSFATDLTENDFSDLSAFDRTHVQMVYVPAVRDGTSQVTAFLRGRLWRAITWSPEIRKTLENAGNALNAAFSQETAVDVIAGSFESRWQEVYTAGTDTKPMFRPVDMRFSEFIRKVEVVFRPDENGRDRSLADLSDGQRSLFHIAVTAAMLDVEASIIAEQKDCFQSDLPLPALTLIAIEEPENNLAPFYLSRIVRQIQDLTKSPRAQAVLSSHSASILARVDPTDVRYFRLEPTSRSARVRAIRLPDDQEEASKFVREAVRTYPELYFARFVILGEGSSEEAVLPRLAEALNLPIDRSFVAIVPLGGRHVNHLWRLLSDLDIPYATLLDLDVGRAGGGWGRIKTACKELLATGADASKLFDTELTMEGPDVILARFDNRPFNNETLKVWLKRLRTFGVFYCWPLDLDMSMLQAFATTYQQRDAGMHGPSGKGDAKKAVLGDDGSPELYQKWDDDLFRWYRYLFLGRGKPTTHVRVLSQLSAADLKARIPEELRALLIHVRDTLQQAQSKKQEH